MNILPEISRKELAKNQEDAWDFLFLFIDKYGEIIASDTQETEEPFNGSQHTLMAFNFLYGEVANGGFLQLIQNGYGRYVFDTPFADTIRAWGAEQTAQIVEEARAVYEEHREELEKEVSIEEFSEMYDEYTDFEPLDDRFYEIMGDDLEIVKKYVENHLGEFAILID